MESQSPEHTSPRPRAGVLVSIVIVVVAGLLLGRMVLGGGASSTPEYMTTTTDLASVALVPDRPTVVVVTADWCGPCQALKRGALSDERVEALLTSKAQTVMIDATDGSKASTTLERLRIRVFPTTVVLSDGRPVASIEGNMPADRYLAWLESQL
ncbi:MAG: thioredoxin fold domain-containing protein [Phycisphaerales bacterium]|jgi:thiol:disulfide interchange protein